MYTLETHYLDVGQGDCSLIIVREDGIPKRTLVYDCGGNSGAIAGDALIRKITNINESREEEEAITKINIAVISHFDKDHFNGFTYLFKEAVNDTVIKSFFSDTILYTRGCIFQRFRTKDLEKTLKTKIETPSFLSAYYFEGSSSAPKTILCDYTSFLDALNKFKSLDGGLEIEHITQSVLAGFPTNMWTQAAYKKGTTTIYNKSWPNRSGKQFIEVEFKKGDHLIGKDLMNDEFKEDEIPIKLICIAVNQYIDHKPDLLKTIKPNKNGNTANNCSIGCLLTFSKFSAFFGGDLEWEIENLLCNRINELTKSRGLSVLKASHHGSGNSCDTSFLKKLTPNTVVITCGAENTHGHPARDTINRLYNETKVEKVLISGFGIREKTSKKKDEEERTAQQKEYDNDYNEKAGEYLVNGIPVGWQNVYDPTKKFILTGGWNNEPGDILIQTTKGMADNAEFTTCFYHPFTNLETEFAQGKRLLSANQSIEMLKYPEGESQLFFSINDSGTSLTGKKRKRERGDEPDKFIEEFIMTVGVVVRGNYIQNGQKKRRIN